MTSTINQADFSKEFNQKSPPFPSEHHSCHLFHYCIPQAICRDAESILQLMFKKSATGGAF